MLRSRSSKPRRAAAACGSSILAVLALVAGLALAGAPRASADTTAPSGQGFGDSGVRFGQIAGRVEALLPSAYLPDGEPAYEGSAAQAAQSGMVLPYDTRITTYDASGVVLWFGDSVFVLKPMTSLVLPGRGKPDSQMKLLRNSLWANVENLPKNASQQIDMSHAVCSTRGATFVLEDDGTVSTVKVIRGSVQFTSLTGATTETVEKGKTLAATAEGMGGTGEFDVDAETADWEALEADPPLGGYAPWAVGLVAVVAVVVIAAIVTAVVLIATRRKRSPAGPPAGGMGRQP
jgi:hypothetical protein